MNFIELPKKFYKACPHSSVTPSSPKWLALSPNKACPTCIVTRVTDVIKQVRDEFAKRGGIFMSRGVGIKPADHRKLICCWRVAKLHGVKVVGLLEELSVEEEISTEDKVSYAKALRVWEKESERLWKVPGLSYEGDEDDMSEEEKEVVRLMMVLLEETVKKMARELDEEDMWVVKRLPVRKDARRAAMRPTLQCQSDQAEKTVQLQPVQPTYLTSPVTPDHPPSPSPVETAKPAQSILKRKSPFLNTLAITPSPSPSETANPTRSILKLKPSSSETPTSVITPRLSLSTTSETSTPTRSILKRKAPSPAPSLSLSLNPQKRVRITSYAIVCSEHLTITNHSLFHALPHSHHQPTVQTHRTITLATKRRPRHAFKRTSEDYVPGKWASPAFSEKANTSHWKTSWPEYKRATRKEEEEWEEERRLEEGLKRVSGVWVVKWWLANVVGRVGLERVRSEVSGEGVGLSLEGVGSGRTA